MPRQDIVDHMGGQAKVHVSLRGHEGLPLHGRVLPGNPGVGRSSSAARGAADAAFASAVSLYPDSPFTAPRTEPELHAVCRPVALERDPRGAILERRRLAVDPRRDDGRGIPLPGLHPPLLAPPPLPEPPAPRAA